MRIQCYVNYDTLQLISLSFLLMCSLYNALKLCQEVGNWSLHSKCCSMLNIQVRVLLVQRLSLHPVTVDLRHQWSDAAALNLGRVESLVESYFLVASTAVSLHAMLVRKQFVSQVHSMFSSLFRKFGTVKLWN